MSADLLLELVADDRQVRRELRDESIAAPVRPDAAVDRRLEAGLEGQLVAGERVAIALAQVGAVVAQIEREHRLGEGDTDVPVGVALVRDTVREKAEAAAGSWRAAVEPVGRAEEPMPDVGGDEGSDAGR